MATEYRSAAEQPGNDTGGNPVNPENLDGQTAPEPAGKPRKPRSDAGKARGPRAAAKAKSSTSSLDLSGLGGVLVGLTAALAEFRNVPEFALDERESVELMGATQNVLRHYNIETTQKGADYIALVGVVTMLFGTRVAAYNLRKRMEREEQRGQPIASNVVRMAAQAPQPTPAAPKPPVQQAPMSAPSGPVDENGTGF